MLFGKKDKEKKKKQKVDIDNSENRSPDNIEVVVGDDSDLEISDIGDYVNNLRPKNNNKDKNKKIVIPKNNKDKNSKK